MVANKKLYAQIFAILLGIAGYFLFQLQVNQNLLANPIHFILQLFIAGSIGLAISFGFKGFYKLYDHYSNKWVERIGPLELFKICNDVTEELQRDISQILMSEHHPDETSQSLFIGRQAECFAFVYGLVLIAMNDLDKTFLQSNRFTKLNERVLQRLVNLAKEKYSSMDIDMDMLEEQLRKTKSKEIESIMTGIEFYQYQRQIKQKNPFAELLKLLSQKTSIRGQKKIQQLLKITENALDKADSLLCAYKVQ